VSVFAICIGLLWLNCAAGLRRRVEVTTGRRGGSCLPRGGPLLFRPPAHAVALHCTHLGGPPGPWQALPGLWCPITGGLPELTVVTWQSRARLIMQWSPGNPELG
jgi:hypothetical protein